MINDNFTIERDVISLAQNICNFLTDNNVRNRAVANVVAAEIAKTCIQDHDVDTESGIHNIAQVLSNLDISDIYIDNNFIDVRIYFDENELCVPKSHYDLDILPLAYMFIKLDEDSTSGNVTGFIFPEDIDTTKNINGYFPVNEGELKSFYDVEARLTLLDDEEPYSEFEKESYDYVDGKPVSLSKFYKTLVTSSEARKHLRNISQASLVFSYMNVVSKNAPVSDEEELNELEDVESNEPLQLDDVVEDLSEAESLSEGPMANLDAIEDGVEDLSEVEALAEPIVDLDAIEDGVEELDEIGQSGDELLAEDDTLEQLPEEEVSDLHEFSEPVTDALQEVIQEDLVDLSETGDEVALPIDEGDDEIQELSSFEYSTDVTPSMGTIEADVDADSDNVIEENEAIDDSESNLNEEESDAIPEYEELPDQDISDETTDEEDKPVVEYEETIDNDAESDIVDGDAGVETPQEQSDGEAQIENLFNEDAPAVVVPKNKKSVLPMVGLIVILGVIGYFGGTKFMSHVPDADMPVEKSVTDIENLAPVNKSDTLKDEAMPIETIENTELDKANNELSAVQIPAIEQNLNASIEVSNLVVNWEVPISYANNTTAKRYFVKLGKVLQLNLKTELLMLSSPPINNRIAIELSFNNGSNKFDIVKITDSSGVEIVDNTIKDTVNKILSMNMGMNMNVFSNLQGNPILVIKL